MLWRHALISRVAVLAVSLAFHGSVSNPYASDELRESHCNLTKLEAGTRAATSALRTAQTGRAWRHLVLRLSVWDTVHFVKVARCGYEVEQSHAFFPLFPGLLRAFASGQGAEADSVAAGILLSNISFVVSIGLLHRLSQQLLRDDQLAATAAILLCWNPASLRSNGASNAAFLAWWRLTALWSQRWSITQGKAARSCLTLAAQGMIVILPTLSFQLWGWHSLCIARAPDDRPEWCRSSWLPLPYGHVQRKFWDVGFLRFYRWKQAPNFLLAAPMLWLACGACASYIRCACHLQQGRGTGQRRPAVKLKHSTWPEDAAWAGGMAELGFYSWPVAPFLCQWACLAATAALFMNIQVITRFCSTCPAFYWYCAHLVRQKRQQWIWWYFASYAFLGALLFPNWFPWV
ncbi:hypothetical protein WJX73_005814 [Symbiochloris irregularis]|uniref:GPI mannosyltransferase 2 n=1 Tax=Symbiochloris irregularis TaxID=706552 RepID=A0AAW1NWW1_9CHLO